MDLELPAKRAPGWRQVLADFGPLYAANAFTGLVFSASGPVAIILSVGTDGKLSPAELASWIFGVFFINGLITIGMSWVYREPLCFFWTIPGTVLVGPALQHLTFPQVIGAFYATAVLLLVLGASGWVKVAMRAIPMPIVMGMVAGVFLRFGLDVVRALHGDFWLAAPMVVAFLAISALPYLARRLPPLIGALLVGAVVAAMLGRIDGSTLSHLEFARPVIQAPAWSLGALAELVVPLAITVLVVQNGQGFAILRAARHTPPVNASTIMCGVGSLFAASVGAVSSCMSGATNALLISSGERERQYVAAMTIGVLAMIFGLLAPTFTGFMLKAPRAFIMVLGGLAMLRVLQAAFVNAFRGKFTHGALVSLIVTVADLPVLNIGGAFWGLVAGYCVSRLLERADFADRAEPA